MATTAYCVLADVKNILSTSAVTLRLDDTPPTAADGDVLDDASRLIDEHCLLFYSEANLALSPWVKHRCAEIAAYLLCERRGNPVPTGLVRRFKRALERLEKCRLGQLWIPDIPMRKAAVPVLSNVRTVLAPVPHTRVQKARSTGSVGDYPQLTDRMDPLDYVI